MSCRPSHSVGDGELHTLFHLIGAHQCGLMVVMLDDRALFVSVGVSLHVWC